MINSCLLEDLITKFIWNMALYVYIHTYNSLLQSRLYSYISRTTCGGLLCSSSVQTCLQDQLTIAVTAHHLERLLKVTYRAANSFTFIYHQKGKLHLLNRYINRPFKGPRNVPHEPVQLRSLDRLTLGKAWLTCALPISVWHPWTFRIRRQPTNLITYTPNLALS